MGDSEWNLEDLYRNEQPTMKPQSVNLVKDGRAKAQVH